MPYYESITLSTSDGKTLKLGVGETISPDCSVSTIFSASWCGFDETVIGLRLARGTCRWYLSEDLIMDIRDQPTPKPRVLMGYKHSRLGKVIPCW